MSAVEITLNMDMKQRTGQNGLYMLFSETPESYLHHNASKERRFSPNCHTFLTFQSVVVCIQASTDSDDAYLIPY